MSHHSLYLSGFRDVCVLATLLCIGCGQADEPTVLNDETLTTKITTNTASTQTRTSTSTSQSNTSVMSTGTTEAPALDMNSTDITADMFAEAPDMSVPVEQDMSGDTPDMTQPSDPTEWKLPPGCIDANKQLNVTTQKGAPGQWKKVSAAIEKGAKCVYFAPGTYNMSDFSDMVVRSELIIAGEPGKTTFKMGTRGGFNLQTNGDLTWRGINVTGMGKKNYPATAAFFSFRKHAAVKGLHILDASFEDFKGITYYASPFDAWKGGILSLLEIKRVKLKNLRAGIRLTGLPVKWSEIDGLDIDGMEQWGLEVAALQRSDQQRYNGGEWRHIKIKNITCPRKGECRGMGIGGRNMLLEHIDIDGTSMTGSGTNHEAFYSNVGPYPTKDSKRDTLVIRHFKARNGQGNAVVTFKGDRQGNISYAGGCNGQAGRCGPKALKSDSGPILLEDFDIIWDYSGPKDYYINGIVWQQSEHVTFRNGTIRNRGRNAHHQAIVQIGGKNAYRTGTMVVDNVTFESPDRQATHAVRINNNRPSEVKNCKAVPKGSWSKETNGQSRTVTGDKVTQKNNQW